MCQTSAVSKTTGLFSWLIVGFAELAWAQSPGLLMEAPQGLNYRLLITGPLITGYFPRNGRSQFANSAHHPAYPAPLRAADAAVGPSRKIV